ncbi:hypothetical protein CR513_00700, partial [Mucuna pruriens]
MLNNNSLLLFGNPTSSDVKFMLSDTRNITSSTLSSTRSDAQSAPPELERVFNQICDKCEDLVLLSNRQVPPEWTMPDLVRAVISDDRIDSPGFLTNDYYDVMLHGQNAWLCEQIFHFLDLINYVF